MDLLDLCVKIGVKDEASSQLDSISSGAIAKGVVIGQAMWSAMSTAASAVAGAVKSVVGGSLEAYSAYEQNLGGVQKIFGNMGKSLEEYASLTGQTADECAGKWQALEDAQNAMLANASNAWQTAGLSASSYMEQATSFGASLVSSLGGDTQKAVEYADMALVDMSDNANTFGTNIESIQDAYQGFAKQNYTMLDNLKLGYGGTQSEMQRLVQDAAAVSDSVDANSLSFDNCVQAIHVMQEQLKVSGTTAREAATTIEGSVNSMKAAWENWLTGLGTEDADLSQLTSNLVTSFENVASNVIPRVATIVSTLIAELPGLLAQAGPTLAQSLQELFGSAFGSVAASLPAELQVVGEIVQGVADVLAHLSAQAGEVLAPALTDTLIPACQNFLTAIEPWIEPITNVANIFGNILVAAITLVVDAVGLIIQIAAEIVNSLTMVCDGAQGFVDSVVAFFSSLPGTISSFLTSAIEAITSWASNVAISAQSAGSQFIGNIVSFFSSLPGNVAGFLASAIGSIASFVGSVASSAASAGSSFLSGISGGFNSAVSFVASIPSRILGALGNVGSLLWDAGSSIINGLLNGLKSAIDGVYSFVSGIAGTIASLKGPLPYDRKLLIPNGRAIMDSLYTGLEGGYGEVLSLVSGMAGGIAGSLGEVAASVTVAPAAQVASAQAEQTAQSNAVLEWLDANLGDVIASRTPYTGMRDFDRLARRAVARA